MRKFIGGISGRYSLTVDDKLHYQVYDHEKDRYSRRHYLTKNAAKTAKQNMILEDKWKKLFKVGEANWTQSQIERAHKILTKIDANNLQLSLED